MEIPSVRLVADYISSLDRSLQHRIESCALEKDEPTSVIEKERIRLNCGLQSQYPGEYVAYLEEVSGNDLFFRLIAHARDFSEYETQKMLEFRKLINTDEWWSHPWLLTLRIHHFIDS